MQVIRAFNFWFSGKNAYAIGEIDIGYATATEDNPLTVTLYPFFIPSRNGRGTNPIPAIPLLWCDNAH
jgi:hypothetical protein